MSYSAAVANAYAQVFECNAPLWNRVTEFVSADLEDSLYGRQTRILDLASGPGEPATTLAKALPNSHITCTDLADDMIQKARERASDLSNVDFATVSADNLSIFPDAAFDAVTMVNGLQFVVDRVRALNEIGRVLRPKCRAYVVIWKCLEFIPPLQTMMKQLVEEENPPYPEGPIALSADGIVDRFVDEVDALHVERVEGIEVEFALGEDECLAFTRGALSFPLISNLLSMMEAGGRSNVRSEAQAAWRSAMEHHGFHSAERGFVLPCSRGQIYVLERV